VVSERVPDDQRKVARQACASSRLERRPPLSSNR
jgi:hypothetical protein